MIRDIECELKEILLAVMMLDEDQFYADIGQSNCEKWDSMQHLNIVVAIEERFAISLEPEEIAEMVSFKKIYEIVSKKID